MCTKWRGASIVPCGIPELLITWLETLPLSFYQTVLESRDFGPSNLLAEDHFKTTGHLCWCVVYVYLDKWQRTFIFYTFLFSGCLINAQLRSSDVWSFTSMLDDLVLISPHLFSVSVVNQMTEHGITDLKLEPVCRLCHAPLCGVCRISLSTHWLFPTDVLCAVNKQHL